MGFVFSKLWNKFFAFQQFKICLVGLNNAGKTTILFQLHLGEHIETHPTIGSNVEEIKHNNVVFQVWDLAGQESLRSAWSTYYSNAHAVIMVVDSSDRNRIDVVKQELQKLLRHEALKDAVILIYANKQDLPGTMSAADVAVSLDLPSIKTHPWHIQGCSAKEGSGLEEGMEWVSTKVKP